MERLQQAVQRLRLAGGDNAGRELRGHDSSDNSVLAPPGAALPVRFNPSDFWVRLLSRFAEVFLVGISACLVFVLYIVMSLLF